MARLNGGTILAAVAGALLLVSLFLDWFEPGLSAWTAFELVDLLLAVAALVAIAAALGGALRAPDAARLAERVMPVVAVAALVLVTAALVNHPPAAVGRGTEAGAWIGLAAAALLAAGAVLRTTELSLVVTRREADEAVPPPSPAPTDAPPTEPLRREP